ncbi:unnamed protein product [Ranitomeya imitator]|uniref:Uncharacterized protein n=1 Tax=Ranitomeya imitator TaxID=111125 RepID=A0ABN9M0K3_9NEOB|nr:unnamed protein product [Ranitomeya imitator]
MMLRKELLAKSRILLPASQRKSGKTKDLLSRLLSQAFETYELEYLITAFLVARQAALEGPAAFMSYTEWFRVHILHPPFVAAKLRPLLMEYITLAKTRLADMKVSIEDICLFEDLSVASDKDQTQPQAQKDVEKAVQIFQNTGRISASVMEARSLNYSSDR